MQHVTCSFPSTNSWLPKSRKNLMPRHHSVGFSISRMRLTIVLKLSSKKWPLGGQNGGFILLKLNNQQVNRRVTRKSIFLLHF